VPAGIWFRVNEAASLVNSRDEQISQIRAAIAAQEAMRATLGDATVELSLKPLRNLLDSLLAEEAAQTGESSREELLAQLQSYIPKQLANKIRTSGHVEGERRPVTVVFADVSGFTALSEKLDPEDVATLMNDCLKELADAVYQYEGMVDKFIGDCIMAVFGAPVALEDDAERALRAALSMRERLERFNQHWTDKLEEPLALHIGINSGTVIAGNVGTDLRMSYTVMGDTVNVASRLEGAAKRGQIFVSQSTYRLAAGAFRFGALEPLTVKGKRDPLTVYELIDAKVQPDKIRGFESLASAFVGREWESKALRKALAAAKAGRSAIAFIYGEAGVGKSRLLSEVRNSEGENLTWLEGRCFAATQTLGYAPFLDLLRRHIGIADEQRIDEQQEALRVYAATNFPGETDAYAVLAQLLALPVAESEAGLLKELKGERFRTRLFLIVEQLLLSQASKRPVVVVIEDLHWADQSSLELLIHIFSLVDRGRLAIIGISRSRRDPSELWDKLAPALENFRERMIEVSLRPLADDASRHLVDELLGGSSLPDALIAEILDKSEGNPFFLEEVLRTLIENGMIERQGEQWVVTSSQKKPEVPDTLQGVLLSRLDRLPENSRRIVQRAAVIGRVFLYRVLEKITEAAPGLDSEIASLEKTDLVREYCRAPEVEYIFKHALTQEVAYQTLLAPARKALHQQVGEAMEILFQDRLQEFAGTLAYHYFSAEAWEKALNYSIRSGDAAFSLCAYAEARGHYNRALTCLAHLEENPEHLRHKIDVTIKLVGASLQAEAPEKNLARLLDAEKVAEQLQDPLQLARVQLWIGRAHYYAGKLKEAIGYFQKVLSSVPTLEDPELAALPGAVIGRVLFMQGKFRESLQLLDRAIPMLESAKSHHEMLFAFMYRGAARTCLGNYAAGMSDLNGALEIARSSRDQNAEAMALTGLALVHLEAGEHAEGILSARKALEVAEKSGDAMFRYSTNSFIAWGTFGSGKAQESLPYWAAAAEAAKPLGGRLLLGEWFAALAAESLVEAGDHSAGLARARQALELSRNTGSVMGEALAERAIARALTLTKETEEALQHIQRSLEICGTIGAKFDVVRAMLVQAQALLAAGRQDEASAVLWKALTLSRECQLEREESIAQSLLAEIKTG
jgi:class 3 adenylate cyclase/tetratricopeptide (TPR) repeat protein